MQLYTKEFCWANPSRYLGSAQCYVTCACYTNSKYVITTVILQLRIIVLLINIRNWSQGISSPVPYVLVQSFNLFWLVQPSRPTKGAIFVFLLSGWTVCVWWCDGMSVIHVIHVIICISRRSQVCLVRVCYSSQSVT